MKATRVLITLDGSNHWEITVSAETLRKADNLPSGKVFMLERRTGDVQTQQIWIKPYYRKMVGGELRIFAVQVKPTKREASNG